MRRRKNTNIIPIIILIIAIIAFIGCGALLLMGLGFFETYDTVTDVAEYQNVIGDKAIDVYQDKWGMDEEIFPASVDGLNVEDFKMIHYDPFDEQFISYLVVNYDSESYRAELERLQELGIDDYEGMFGSTGFSYYNLLAMRADSYQGLIYALTDNQSRIIYVELIFCNYYFDIPYQKEIPLEYLPDGFDATEDNPYRNQMLSEH